MPSCCGKASHNENVCTFSIAPERMCSLFSPQKLDRISDNNGFCYWRTLIDSHSSWTVVTQSMQSDDVTPLIQIVDTCLVKTG